MKRPCLLALLFIVPLVAAAQSPRMTVKLKDGTRYSYALQDIRKITFGTVTAASGNPQLQHVIQAFALFQNYPNPFNPTTTIRYELPRAGDVHVSIYNIAGQLVRTFTADRQQPGVYEVVWDGLDDHSRAVASGLYVYRVTFGQNALQRKMLYLK